MSTAPAYDYAPSRQIVPRRMPDRSTPTLFDDAPPDDSIEARFQAFHTANPLVYSELVRLTREAKQAGRRPSIKSIWEDLRETLPLDPTGRRFKLDNTYTALYSRLVMDTEPDLAGFFKIRPRGSVR